MENFQTSGLWYLPSAPDNIVAGTLNFSNEKGISLELLGVLNTAINDLSIQELIIGITSERKTVTLINARRSHFQFGFPGFAIEHFMAQFILIGVVAADKKDIKFEEAAVDYTYLPYWFDRTGINTATDMGNDNKQHYRASSSTILGEIAQTENSTIQIISGISISPKRHNYTVTETIALSIKLSKSISMEEYFSTYIRPLQNFLSLATGRPNSLVNLFFYYNEVDDQGENTKRQVEVYFQQVYVDKEPIEDINSTDMLFVFNDIEDKFSSVINNWFKIDTELRVTCNLYFGSQYRPGGYSETSFLSMVQTAEIYHRTRFDNKVERADKFGRKRGLILNKTPRVYNRWLKEKIAHANEPTLRHRLDEMIQRYEDIMIPLIKNRESFVRRVAYTRNYFTHYSPKAQRHSLSGERLHRVSEALNFLMQRCLLDELGFSSEQCIQLFQHNSRYVQAVRRFPNLENN